MLVSGMVVVVSPNEQLALVVMVVEDMIRCVCAVWHVVVE